MEKITAEQAEKILGDVDPTNHFWLKDGRALRNIQDLHDTIPTVDDETLKHHVNENKNDFSSWVMEVHQDEELAKKLLDVTTQKQIKELVSTRIGELERVRNVQKKMAEKKQKTPKRTDAAKVVKAVGVKPITVKPVAHECSKKHFMKCSSQHFLWGVLVGMVVGLFVSALV